MSSDFFNFEFFQSPGKRLLADIHRLNQSIPIVWQVRTLLQLKRCCPKLSSKFCPHRVIFSDLRLTNNWSDISAALNYLNNVGLGACGRLISSHTRGYGTSARVLAEHALISIICVMYAPAIGWLQVVVSMRICILRGPSGTIGNTESMLDAYQRYNPLIHASPWYAS